MDYVLGFTASNDVSARRLQNITSQWCFSKGLDGSCPLGGWHTYYFCWRKLKKCQLIDTGPVLVTRDAIPNPQDLRIRTLYNGDIVQDDSTR
jgi:2-keto-4-pentenoate hydratase/2-oxohepta-3-ene-1,7-dioic acid hydratase in catechol pathway